MRQIGTKLPDVPKPPLPGEPPKREGFGYYLHLAIEWGKAKFHIYLGRY